MKNIAILGYSLHHGGADKNFANISLLLKNIGYNLHTIIVNDGIDYQYGGKLLNLGLLPNKTPFQRLRKFTTLYQYLKKNKISYLIDFRSRVNDWEEIMISNILFQNCKPIYTIHSYQLENYLPKNKWLFKLWTIKKPLLISVSQEIQDKIEQNYNYKNIKTIKNPLDFTSLISKSNETIVENENFILFVGRLSYEKQIPELIECYSKSKLPNQNIKLFIIGEGEEFSKIEIKIKELKLQENVVLLGKKLNPFSYMKRAKFLVLCSKFEGYPTVMIESLAVGTPVVSFDCSSGPKEIIKDKKNGLLVDNQNFTALTKSMNLMFEDEEMYMNCKKNTLINIEQHTFENVLKKWIEILN
jgi:N-acetylgalactosamine-N,N'-diacetylbacillosaminyl-diphospho-undecaprenol 4-alpha-N-acetylgalactosaminyltransferase